MRYAFAFRDRFRVVPMLGYGRSGYDLERRGQPAPSSCVATTTQVCLPDVQVSHLTIGFDARAEGLFWCAAQGGFGIQTAPALARTAAALLRGLGVPDDIAGRGLAADMLAPDRPGLVH